MPLPPEENILRAICTDKIDEGVISPSLFKGSNTSVSRPALIPLEDHWDLFRSHVQRPPERLLVSLGEIYGKLPGKLKLSKLQIPVHQHRPFFPSARSNRATTTSRGTSNLTGRWGTRTSKWK